MPKIRWNNGTPYMSCQRCGKLNKVDYNGDDETGDISWICVCAYCNHLIDED